MQNLTPTQLELIRAELDSPDDLINELSSRYGWNPFSLRWIIGDLIVYRRVDDNVPCQKTIIREAIKRSRVFLETDEAIEVGELNPGKLSRMRKAARDLEIFYDAKFPTVE